MINTLKISLFCVIAFTIVGFPNCNPDKDSLPNNRPKWKTAPVDVTVIAGESYDAVNGVATDSDTPNGKPEFPGYLKCASADSTCSFPVTVVGQGPGEAKCRLSFDTGAGETCCVMIFARDGYGSKVKKTITITVNQPTIDISGCAPNPADEGATINCTVTAEFGAAEIDPLNDTCGGELVEGNYQYFTTEADGPRNCVAAVQLTEFNDIKDSEPITINEISQPPTNNAPATAGGDELTQITFDIAPTDPDIPAAILTCSIVINNCPAGTLTGCVFQWTPTEVQGPNTGCDVTTQVSDGFATDEVTTTITVNEVNQVPVWTTAPSDITIRLFDSYDSVNGQASDGDLPNSVAADPGYLTCSKGADNCSFEVTVSGSGKSAVNCDISFPATADLTGAYACSVGVIVTDGMGSSISSVVNINVLGKIYFVDEEGLDDTGCQSWDDACKTVQGAVNLASNGDVVFVRVGSYHNDPESALAVLTMKDGVKVYGGFFGYETQLSQRVLAGSLIITTELHGDWTSEHVVIGANNAVLDGFGIHSGYAGTGAAIQKGAGMLNQNVSYLEIANCLFAGNFAYDAGAGMYNYNSYATVSNTFFEYNGRHYESATSTTYYTHYGAGIYNKYSDLVISNSIITGCKTNPLSDETDCLIMDYGSGIGIFNKSSSLAINSSEITENITEDHGYGGGIYNYNSTLTMKNSEIKINGSHGYGYGGGIYNSNSNSNIDGCYFYFNWARDGYGGAIANVDSSMVISNSIFTTNFGARGAGIFNDNSSTYLSDSDMIMNISAYGGGFYNTNNSYVNVADTLFYSNKGSYYFSGGRYAGGGMYNDHSAAVISDSIFFKNMAFGKGGGLFNTYSNLYVENSDFIQNQAVNLYVGAYGGGMYNYHSNLTINNSVFHDNLAIAGDFLISTGGAGGGLFNHASSVEISQSEFSENEGGLLGGGAILDLDSDLVLRNSILSSNFTRMFAGAVFHGGSSLISQNNLFSNNGARTWSWLPVPMPGPISFIWPSIGGAMIIGGANAEIENNTFSQNYATASGAIAIADSTVTISNSILWGDYALVDPEITAASSYVDVINSDVMGGFAGSSVAVISDDPLFINVPAFSALTWDISLDHDMADLGGVASIFSVGDVIEIANDGVPRTVTSIGDYCYDKYPYDYVCEWTMPVYVYFDPPRYPPPCAGMLISNWLPGATNVTEDLHLSQPPDQVVTSPAVNTGNGAVPPYLLNTTTSTSGVPDTGTVDMGYHFPLIP